VVVRNHNRSGTDILVVPSLAKRFPDLKIGRRLVDPTIVRSHRDHAAVADIPLPPLPLCATFLLSVLRPHFAPEMVRLSRSVFERFDVQRMI